MTYSDYLQHHGILGMKWGQRNGPPYPLTSSQMNSKERANKNLRPKDLSDSDLDARLNRLRKESELRRLEANDISNGKRFVTSLLLAAGSIGLVTFTTSLARKYAEDKSGYVYKRFGGKVKKAAFKDALDFAKSLKYDGDMNDIKSYSAYLKMIEAVTNHIMLEKGFGKVYS